MMTFDEQQLEQYEFDAWIDSMERAYSSSQETHTDDALQARAALDQSVDVLVEDIDL